MDSVHGMPFLCVSTTFITKSIIPEMNHAMQALV